MFSRRIHLFTLLGFRVGLDLSWFLLAILLVWSLTVGYFPSAVPGLGGSTYFWMGIVGALGLFASIVFHEFAHALVARRFDLPMGGITLFIFGGIAEMEDEPATPKAEFNMAIAGPIASLFLGGVFYALAGVLGDGNQVVAAVVGYLGLINLLLAAFNMLPAFPLDGGRVLRSVLWWVNGDLRKSTRIAAMAGAILGAALMVLGVINIVSGAFVAGMWQLLIGFFIQSAAGASRSQIEMREGLKNIRVRDVMNKDVVGVPPHITVASLVHDYVYRYYHKFFPVIGEDGRVLGCVRLASVREVPRERWGEVRVADVMEPVSDSNRLGPAESAVDALRRMQKGGVSRFLVMQGGRLLGVLSMRDVLNALTVRLDLGEAADTAAPALKSFAGGAGHDVSRP